MSIENVFVSKTNGTMSYTGLEGEDRDTDRLNRHISAKTIVTPGNQQFLQNQDTAPQYNYKPQGKSESWVDLHQEYNDVLDQQELQKYRRHFRAMGANDSGFITCTELKQVMEDFFGQDLTKQQIQETIAQIDYDGDGQISYREFLEAMCAQKAGNKTKFGGFYHVLTLKNPPFWSQRVSKANAV